MTERRSRVVVLSPQRLEGQVAGTGIRALELARALSATYDVRLAAVGRPPGEVIGLPCTGYDPQAPRALAEPVGAADAVVSVAQWPPVMRLLRRSGTALFFDLYVPEAIETLGGFPGDRRRVRSALVQFATDRLVDTLRAGSGFVCATERQRDLILGVMLAERLLLAERHDDDPSWRSVLDVVPFGLPEAPPVAAGDGPRSAFGERIGPDDEIVLWNGGIWPWLDPQTAVRAVVTLARRRPSVRLVFMGAATQVPAQRATAAAKALARELGELDRTVLFHEDWVPYERRADWLLAADCALSTHEDHLETRFAFRTRLLDCFWAGLPVVCTAGDDLAEVVEREGGGYAVAPGDAGAAADAIERVLDRGRATYAPALGRIAQRYTWPKVVRPLSRMIADGAGAPARRPPLRAGQAARRAAYLGARSALNAVGLTDWPRL